MMPRRCGNLRPEMPAVKMFALIARDMAVGRGSATIKQRAHGYINAYIHARDN